MDWEEDCLLRLDHQQDQMGCLCTGKEGINEDNLFCRVLEFPLPEVCQGQQTKHQLVDQEASTHAEAQ